MKVMLPLCLILIGIVIGLALPRAQSPAFATPPMLASSGAWCWYGATRYGDSWGRAWTAMIGPDGKKICRLDDAPEIVR
jgi:hypothetical protein